MYIVGVLHQRPVCQYWSAHHLRRGVQVPCTMCDIPSVIYTSYMSYISYMSYAVHVSSDLPSVSRHVSLVSLGMCEMSPDICHVPCGVHLMSWILYQWQICDKYVLFWFKIQYHLSDMSPVDLIFLRGQWWTGGIFEIFDIFAKFARVYK